MKIILTILLIFIFGCKAQTEKQEDNLIEIEEVVQVATESDFTVISFDSSMNHIFENVNPTELSKPEIEEVNQIIDEAIKYNNERQKLYLDKHNEEYPKHPWTETGFELDLDNNYFRQYVPVTNSKGEKEVWINFF